MIYYKNSDGIYRSTYYKASSDIYHHGILGQKWGVRRFQNPDGTLTEAGKKRYNTAESPLSNLNKREKLKYYSETTTTPNNRSVFKAYLDILESDRKYDTKDLPVPTKTYSEKESVSRIKRAMNGNEEHFWEIYDTISPLYDTWLHIARNEQAFGAVEKQRAQASSDMYDRRMFYTYETVPDRVLRDAAVSKLLKKDIVYLDARYRLWESYDELSSKMAYCLGFPNTPQVKDLLIDLLL